MDCGLHRDFKVHEVKESPWSKCHRGGLNHTSLLMVRGENEHLSKQNFCA